MRKVIFLFIFATLAGTVFAQEAGTPGPFSFVLSPSVTLPLGPGSNDFSMGGGGKLAAEYAFPDLRNLSLRLGFSYDYEVLQAGAGSTSELAALAGAAWRFPIVAGLSARAFAGAGYSFGFMNGDSLANGGAGAIAEAGAGIAYAFGPILALRFDLSYLYYLGLYGGLNASLALSVTPPSPKRGLPILPSKPRNLVIGEIKLSSVFPIFHTWYDQNPVGKVTVTNTGKELITNVDLSFLIKQYMDGPKECALIAELGPDESIEVPLYALFNSSILDVTEATKATSQVDAAYMEAGERQSQSKTATIRIYNRNAMTWDDDRKAAAFVSGKDPWVLDFSNNITAMVKGLVNPNINRNLQLAIAFHNAIRLYGMSYTPNPTTPYSQSSKNPEIVDFLKFPRQTLSYKAGDCSDLSILYASFFESVGVQTAFITVPGHIFMAVDLGITPEEAKTKVADYGDLIIRDGKVWLPVETTLPDQGLLGAWRRGAQEWKESTASRTAALYPVHEAWKLYEPVGLAADRTTVRLPETRFRHPVIQRRTLSVRRTRADYTGGCPRRSDGKNRADNKGAEPARSALCEVRTT